MEYSEWVEVHAICSLTGRSTMGGKLKDGHRAASMVVKDVKTNRQGERVKGIPVLDEGWRGGGGEAAVRDVG